MTDGSPMSDVPTRVETIEELIQLLDLTDVRCYKLHAEASDQPPAGTEPESATLQFKTALRRHEGGIDYRVDVRVKRPSGKVRVDVAASYTSATPFIAPDEVIANFGENVAAMTVIPYIRQHLSDITQRVGSPFLLPILPRGLIRFTRDGDGRPEIQPDSD